MIATLSEYWTNEPSQSSETDLNEFVSPMVSVMKSSVLSVFVFC